MAQYTELVHEAKQQFQREVSSLTPEIQANWKGLSKYTHYTHQPLLFMQATAGEFKCLVNPKLVSVVCVWVCVCE